MKRKYESMIAIAVVALFIFSAFTFSGSVMAGKPPPPPAQTGTCVMNKDAYNLGETISISASGTGGAGGTKTYFEVLLKNPSGTIVKSQQYTGTSFSGTVTYTLSTSDPTGTWTAQTTYNTRANNGRITTKVLATDTASVNPMQLQDFVAVDIWTTPTVPIGGQSAIISYQIALNNAQWTGTIYTDLYIDNGPTYVARQSLVWSSGMPTSYTYTYTTTLPAGNHVIKMVTDSTNVVTESSETNNERTETINWIAVQDFVAVDIRTSPDPPVGGYPVTISYQISLSSVQWTGTIYTDLYIDNGPTYVARQPLTYYAGMPTSFTYTYMTNLATGNHVIRMVTDSTNVVSELSETNNERIETITWQAPVVSWVLMVYLCGDNLGCNPGGFDIMNHISAATHSSQVRTIVMLDPNSNWDTHPEWGAAANGNARYYELFQGSHTLLADLGEINMGDMATLRDFIHYSEDLYPSATNYGLVLFDNGRNWKGVCYDVNPNFDFLTAIEINTALRAAKAMTNKALSLLGFDACVMQSAEVAYENRGNAMVMVASEELEWFGSPISDFESWPWQNIITDLSNNYANDAKWLGSQIVTDFKDMWEHSTNPDWHSAISAIDLSYMYNLAVNGIGPLGTGLQNCIVNGYWANINQIRGQMEQYALETLDGKYRFIDLYEFANRVGQDMGSIIDTATQNAINYIKTNVVIDKAIINEWHRTGYSGDHTNAKGLGIYFPIKTPYYYWDSWYYTDYSGLLMSVGSTSGWCGFLKKFVGSVWYDEFSDADISDWSLRGYLTYNTITVESGNLKMVRTAKDSFCDAIHTFTSQSGHLVISAKIVVSSNDPNKWVFFSATYGGPEHYVAYVMFKDGNLIFSDGTTIMTYASTPNWYFITMELDLVNGKCDVQVISPAQGKVNPILQPYQINEIFDRNLVGGITHASVDGVYIINGNWPDNYITTWVDYVAVTYW